MVGVLGHLEPAQMELTGGRTIETSGGGSVKEKPGIGMVLKK